MNREPLLLIGMGHPWRGDDGLGPWIVQRVNQARLPQVETALVSDGFDLLSRWQSRQRVCVVDALRGAGPPGSLHRIDALRQPIPHDSVCLSHGFGLAAAVALGRSLQQLPQQLELLGIEAQQFELGQGLSLVVQQAAERMLAALADLNAPGWPGAAPAAYPSRPS